MTDTRVAVVGCGGMGRHHLDVLAEIDEFVTVGLCDVSAEALAASGDKYAVADRFTDIEELLDKAGPDIVVVATQTRHHHEPTVAACRPGKQASSSSGRRSTSVSARERISRTKSRR